MARERGDGWNIPPSRSCGHVRMQWRGKQRWTADTTGCNHSVRVRGEAIGREGRDTVSFFLKMALKKKEKEQEEEAERLEKRKLELRLDEVWNDPVFWDHPRAAAQPSPPSQLNFSAPLAEDKRLKELKRRKNKKRKSCGAAVVDAGNSAVQYHGRCGPYCFSLLVLLQVRGC